MNSKTILITGASKGIGLAIARHLHAQGHRVIGTSRRPQDADTAGIHLLPLDVTQPDSIRAAVDAALAQAGRIDVLINNAGYDLYGAVEETSSAELSAQMTTNFTGAVELMRAVLPHLRAQGGGRIINLSSIGGLVSLPFNSAYAASKFALEGFSEALRYEVLRHNIYVSLVEPGPVRTDTLDTSIQSTRSDHPLYAGARQRLIAAMRETGRTSSVTPDQIARVVEQIIASPAPRLRYPVGLMARLLPLAKGLLPSSVFEGFMLRQFVSDPAQAPLLEGSHAR